MSALARFLGGSPLGVLVRLFVLSLVVGWFLHRIDWTPRDVWVRARDVTLSLWSSFGALGEYALLGAAVVVPVFLVLRLLRWRRT